GLTEIPFGFELVDSARDRVFMERSQASLAFFPNDPGASDAGVRLWGGVGFFRYAIGFFNGEPLVPKSTGDTNAAKDFVVRWGVDTRPIAPLHLTGGVSVLRGQGFHAGTPSTKNALAWHDINENGAVDPGETVAVPGSAATPSQNFSRWAVGVD